jgi:hypothetical protein
MGCISVKNTDNDVEWTLRGDAIISAKINGKLLQNDGTYKNAAMTITFEDTQFAFLIYDNKKNLVLDNTAYQLDNYEIKYEKGIPAENNIPKIEEAILVPFLLANEEFEITFFNVLDAKTDRYIFKLKGNNFPEIWSGINGKIYEHLPVWESAL